MFFDGRKPSELMLQGLLREDLILSFGSLTKSSFSSNALTPLANLVAANENVSASWSQCAAMLYCNSHAIQRELLVRVLRPGDQVVTLTFIPRKGWGGRGLLG